MNAFVLFLFTAVSVGLVIWGLARHGRIYEYPFLVGAVWVGWFLPQAVGLLNDYSLPEGGYALTMFVATLCVVATFAGYNSRPRPLRALAWRLDPHRLLAVALFFSLVGSFFNFWVRGLPDELIRPQTGQMSGLPTVLLFFASVQNYGFAIAALLYARTRSLPSLAICAYDLAWFLDAIILLARRTQTIEITLVILLSAWFTKRWIVPRWAAGAGTVLATLAVASIGFLRSVMVATYGDRTGRFPTWEEFTSIDFVGNLSKIANEGGEGAIELRNAIYNLAATELTGGYNLGATYWNDLVFRYVPAQFLGAEFKSSLMINVTDVAAWVYMHQPTLGTTETGVSDSFMAFWFFGPLVFFLVARIMGKLYRAGMEGQTIAQLYYMFLMGNALETVTHTTSHFFSSFIQIGIFTLPAFSWARIPNNREFGVPNLPRRRPRVVR
jgi:hypothetical protein